MAVQARHNSRKPPQEEEQQEPSSPPGSSLSSSVHQNNKASSSRRRRRRVRFDEGHNQYYSVHSEENVGSHNHHQTAAQSSLWYSATEMEGFRRTNMVRYAWSVNQQVCDDIEKKLGSYQEYRQQLLTTFDAAQVGSCGSSSSSSGSFLPTIPQDAAEAVAVVRQLQQQLRQQQQQQRHQHCKTKSGSRGQQQEQPMKFLLSPSQRREWDTLYNDFPERLGLERTIVARLRHDKADRHHALLTCIVAVESIPIKDSSSTTTTTTTTTRRADYLQTLCDAVTLPSRLFAHELARALHQSCLHDDDDEDRDDEPSKSRKKQPPPQQQQQQQQDDSAATTTTKRKRTRTTPPTSPIQKVTKTCKDRHHHPSVFVEIMKSSPLRGIVGGNNNNNNNNNNNSNNTPISPRGGSSSKRHFPLIKLPQIRLHHQKSSVLYAQ